MGKATAAPEWESTELGSLWVVTGGDVDQAICSVIADPADGDAAVAFEVAGSGGTYVQARAVTAATRLRVVDAAWPDRMTRLAVEHGDMRSRLQQIAATCAGARTSATLTVAGLLEAIEPLVETQLKGGITVD